MATAADLCCNPDKLEQCDYHAKKWTTYCSKENMVCCDECLTKHSKCLEYHKNIQDVDLGSFTDHKIIISQIQKYISEEEEIATGLNDEERNIANSINDIELCQRYMNNMFDQMKKELEPKVEPLIAEVKRRKEKVAVRMSYTESIWESVKSVRLPPALLFVACQKIKQCHDTITKAFSNTPSYGSQVKKAIGQQLNSSYPQLKKLYDYYKQFKGSSTTSHTGEHMKQYVPKEYEEEEKQDLLQKQAQKEKQRQAEASKEMLYRVYGNVVVTLEEYEGRTGGKRLSKSKLDIPDQSWKTDEDVMANVESQLVVFEAHSDACPSDVFKNCNRELRIKTIYWAAVREEKGMRLSETDIYLAQLYEILVKKKTHHTMFDQPRQKVTETTIKKTMSHIVRGKNEAMELDSSFKNNPTKKASGPQTRTTRNASDIGMGAKRIRDVDESLYPFLQEDVQAHMLEIGDIK